VSAAPAQRRVRVVQVVNSLAPAGAERVTVELARRLDPDRFDVHVLVVRDGPLRAELQAAGVAVSVTGGEFDLRAPAVVARMHAQMRSFRPDIVHTHLIGADVVGRTAALLAGVPVIVSTQHDVYERPGVLAAFRRLSARRVSAVAAVSDAVVPYCLERLHMPAERVVVIPNGVDVDRVRCERAPTQGFAFGALGSLVPAKAHDTLLRAFARAELPASTRLRIAGEGPLREPLTALAEELGIAPRVDLLGQVEDVAEFFAGVDAFVHPSREEGLPLALLEAMAAGLPVIATRLPALSAALDDGAAGLLVPRDDPDALARALERVCACGPDTQRMAQTALERACELYSVDRMVEEYAALYERLLAGVFAEAVDARD